MNRQDYILHGLSCANCAMKIEEEVNGLPGVDASLNFISKTITVTSEEDPLDQIQVIARRHEPDIIVKRKVTGASVTEETLEEEEWYEGSRKDLIRLALGGVLYAAGILAAPGVWESILFLASYFIAGGTVLVHAAKGILHGRMFNEQFLMTIATLGAFVIGEYAEAAAVMLFYLVGELFQNRAVDHSRRSISALLDLRPDQANLIAAEGILIVSPDQVKIGDQILVKPGERIPLDGVVIAGDSVVDTSALTGESVPRELTVGSAALSGFVNQTGVLTIQVEKDFAGSTISKILDLVQNASSRKAPTESFMTRFARYYTPAVVFGALAVAFLPPLVLEGASLTDWIYRALVFLMVSCPCALVISIPLGFFGGIGGASRQGIMVKGGNYLEALNDVELVVFDKTGTLTKGVFGVTQIHPGPSYTEDTLLELAALAESMSNHPIARSILDHHKSRNLDHDRIQNYQEVHGQGIRVTIDGKLVLAGNQGLLSSAGILAKEVDPSVTAVHLAVEGSYAGCILLADEIKSDAAEAIASLKKLGIRNTVMLSGDRRSVAERVGEELGINQVYSELLPQEKVERLEELEKNKSRKGKVVYVGDGINDSPVLARADVGIAMGGLGSDAAIEAADIVIMTDEPGKIVTAIQIARRTRTIVYQNIYFAIGIKLLVMALGAAGLATLWEAVFADIGVALLAVFNSLRVLNTKV